MENNKLQKPNESLNNTYYQEDEIDLKELFGTIWKNKFLIAAFTFIVTSLTIVYCVSLPNKYKSSIIFQAQGGDGKSNLGGLSSLAGLAGISMGGSSGENLGPKIELLVKDFVFNEKIVKKYKIDEIVNSDDFDKDFVFTAGYRGIYDLFNGEKKGGEEPKTKEELIKDTVKMLTKGVINFSISKKEGFFTLEAEHSNKDFAKKMVDIYLKELVAELKNRDMETLEKKLSFYQEELAKTSDLELKGQLSEQIGTLLKKKVLSNVNELYLFELIIDSRVPYDDEKSGPKRALIVVVSFVTSIILGIFGVFFREFLQDSEEEKYENKN